MGVREADRLASLASRRHREGGHEEGGHGKGGRQEAERLYCAALAACPGHAESLHGLGCLAQEAGQPERAIGLIGQALAAAPENAAYTISLGLALLACSHVEEARAALHVAVLRDNGDPRARRGLAQALSRLGRLAEAETHLRRAIELDPRAAAAWLSLGGVQRARGAADAAIGSFREAARLAPGDALNWHALGACCAATGALDEAEAAFRRVATLLPEDAAAQANLGAALFAVGRLEEAQPCLERARARAPDNALTLSSLGLVLFGLGETLEAERVLARASKLAPDSVALAVNHGTALAAAGQAGEAEALFRSVLSRESAQAQARFNLGTLLLARGSRAEGWRTEGWAAFEARRALVAGTHASGAGGLGLAEWDGAALHAGAVLISAEQGLGDTIQFLRWVGLASARAPIVLELPHALLRLVGEAPPFDPAHVRIVASSAEADGCVARTSLLSLPHLLGGEAIPPLALRADPEARRAWRARLPEGRLRVGLAWAGAAAYRFDRARSIRLAQLAPLAAAGDVAFVSLQQGPAASEAPSGGMTLALTEAAFADLAETAALIEALDLVISVDTMIAHLAGALGRPVWLLDRFGGDWRWQPGFADGRDWYPTLRRFGQAAPLPPARAWDQVIDEVAECLSRLDAPPPGRS